ncbi:MAG: vitamin K epoxide reductase family protein [Chloroflexota bacterium]
MKRIAVWAFILLGLTGLVVLGTKFVQSSHDQDPKTPVATALIATATAAEDCDDCEVAAGQMEALSTLTAKQRQPTAMPVSALPVVRAVLFWMDDCPHCHDVLDNVLPPLQAKYGDQFEIFLIELVTIEDVDRLYQTAASFGIPKEGVGVPFLVIGDKVFQGADQIPTELPGLIEKHLTAGGLNYPYIPVLIDILPPEISTIQTVAQTAESRPQGPSTVTLPRPAGFVLSIAIMVGMLAALVYTGVRIGRVLLSDNSVVQVAPISAWKDIAIPMLALLGLGVAGYLAYVETQSVSAVCGPIGDCNAVQSSPYAKLFGVLPIGVLGALGYIIILGVWAWSRWRQDWLAGKAPLALFGITFFGTLFSLYLTYLEPFVINAVCMWCISSAIIITLLLLLSLNPMLEQLTWDEENDLTTTLET